MQYQLNDPSTPDLLIDMQPTVPEPHFPYTVRGCTADDQVGINCKTSLDISLNYLSNILPVLHWSSTPNLQIWPKAGKAFNAYYDRPNIKYFFDTDPLTQQVFFAANSSKICTHELGHATLDAIRPDCWSTQCAEIWGYHEGHGDINAVNTVMQSDLVLETALKETDGNLRLSSIISRLAEEFGNAFWHARGHKDNNFNGLRNAVNTFTFIPPENLPPIASDDQLSRECHSYGRLILGVWYDVLVGIYEQEKAGGLNQMDAIKKARDVAFPLLIKTIAKTPITLRFHQAIARIMLTVDQENGGHYQNVLNKVFTDRKLLAPQMMALSATNKNELDLTNGITTPIRQGEMVVIHEPKTLRLSDYITEPQHLRAMFVGGYDLSSCEVEVAAGKYYEFDQSGNLLHEIVPTDQEIIEEAQKCVTEIESIGPGPDTMWEVTNNKLLRTFICGRK